MNNKDLFINGFLDRISSQFKQSNNTRLNRDLAFEILGIAAAIDKPFQEVFDKVIIKDKSGKKSGSQDGGIDGIWFNDLGEYYDMHVFQCKNTPSLRDNEVDKFRNDVKDIFNDGNKVNKKNIDDLIPFINEYKNISLSGKVIDVKLYYIYSGVKNDETHKNNEKTFEIYNNPDKLFWIYDSNWIFERLSSFITHKRNKVEFTFHPLNSNFSKMDTQALYTYSIENTRAANFRITALELCQLIEKEVELNKTFDLLFEENIRQYLGLTKFRANRKMNETLRGEDSVLFPFLNNGITIVTEQMTIPRTPQTGEYNLPVVNPLIVNGLQTSRVLYDIYKEEKIRSKLTDVYVNLRVYESNDLSLIEKITDATNTQTPITYKDKISNKDFNDLAKTVFNNSKIEYITKRGEGFSPNTKSFSNQIDSETVIKFWYATFYEEPETAKNSIARVLQEIYDASTMENHPLSFLFSGDSNSPIYKQFLTVYKIYKFVQENKSLYLPKNELVAYADEMLSYGIYKYLGNNLNSYDIQDNLKAAYEDTLEIITKTLNKYKSELEEKNLTLSFNGYFKKPKCRVDFNEEKGIIESESLIEDIKKIR